MAEGFYPAGSHTAAWRAADRPSGLYGVRLEGDGFALTRLVLLK